MLYHNEDDFHRRDELVNPRPNMRDQKDRRSFR